MVRIIMIAVVALTAVCVGALSVAHHPADMVERSIINPDGTTSNILINRAFYDSKNKLTRQGYPTQDFYPTDAIEALCYESSSLGLTNIVSPYVEDCASVLSYVRDQIRGYWNLRGLVAGQNYALVQHNTCTLYCQVDQGHDSLQIATGDLSIFVNNTINLYKQNFNDGKFDRVEGTERLLCWEANGATPVNGTLSLKR